MIYILFDQSEGEYSFISKFWGDEIKEIYSPKKNKKLFSWMAGAIKALLVSRRQDILICWFDFQAILCYWIGLFIFKPRRIVCVNVMLKDKKTLRNMVVGWLYKVALGSKRFRASVTSSEYGEWLKRRLGTNCHFYLVRDVYHSDYTVKMRIHKKHNLVFCGGSNGRDWNLLCKVAWMIPDVSFLFVIPGNLYENVKECVPDNVDVRYNISYDEFLQEISRSEIVALPLDTIAPAGLIVMFQAAANGCLVIMTDTVTTRGYINSNRGALLPNDPEVWVKCIRSMLENSTEREKKAKDLKLFLETECNEVYFVESIKQMLW